MRTLLVIPLAALTLAAMQKYSGPRPPKPDLPYLVHADTLVPTEASEAKEQKRKDGILYVIAGANSPVKTPLASPVLLLQAEKLDPEQLELYKLDSRNGQREIFASSKKNKMRPIRMELTRLAAGLVRLEVDESLSPGEYSLSPKESNEVFCFAVE